MIPCSKRNSGNELSLKLAEPMQGDSQCLNDETFRYDRFGVNMTMDSVIGTEKPRSVTTKNQLPFVNNNTDGDISSFPSIEWMSDSAMEAPTVPVSLNSGHQNFFPGYSNQQWPRRVSNNELDFTANTSSSDEMSRDVGCRSHRRPQLVRSLALTDSLFTLDSSNKHK